MFNGKYHKLKIVLSLTMFSLHHIWILLKILRSEWKTLWTLRFFIKNWVALVTYRRISRANYLVQWEIPQIKNRPWFDNVFSPPHLNIIQNTQVLELFTVKQRVFHQKLSCLVCPLNNKWSKHPFQWEIHDYTIGP